MDYVIEDVDDRLRDSAIITIVVNCLRAKPITGPKLRNTDENNSIDIYSLTNDKDRKDDSLILKEVGQSNVGTVEIDADKVTYTPSKKRCDQLAVKKERFIHSSYFIYK